MPEFDASTVVTSRTLQRLARRVTGINDTTKDRIRSLVVEGVDAGLSPAQVGRGLRGIVPPLPSDATGQALARKLGSFGSELRAETIARTEMRVAQNGGQLDQFAALGTTQVELIDGDDDPVCAGRNGQIVSLDMAETIMYSEHPNGTLTFAPVVGGDNGIGGKPPAEVRPDPIEEWLGRQPEDSRDQIREWLVTSEDVEARVMRMRLGETPELADTLQLWQETTFDDVRTAIRSNRLDVGQDVTHIPEMARQILDEVAHGTKAPTLFRGAAIDSGTRTRLASLKPGTKVDMNVASWSGTDDAATWAAEYRDAQRKYMVRFELEPGAKGVRLADHIEDFSDEWITDGRMEVVAAIKTEEGVEVILRQLETFEVSKVPTSLLRLR